MTKYIIFFGLFIFCLLFTGWASLKVKLNYRKYGKVRNSSNMNGFDTATKLLRSKNIIGVSVCRVSGTLSDHFDPKKSVVNLSDSTYSDDSIAAVAVAAHEIGHVAQKEDNYFLYNLRTLLVPVVNTCSRLAFPLVIVGLIIDIFVTTSNPQLGFNIAILGVAFYGSSLLFTLTTLPVELNASRRALSMLKNSGILTSQEMPGARKMLSSAALTYVAALFTSIVYFLRFLLYVLAVFGKRRR